MTVSLKPNSEFYAVITARDGVGNLKTTSLVGEHDIRLEVAGADYTYRFTLVKGREGDELLVQYAELRWKDAQRALPSSWETVFNEVVDVAHEGREECR